MDSLAGTSWYCRDEGTRIAFTGLHTGRVVDGSGIYHFSYTYTPPVVLFSFSPDDENGPISGTVGGNFLIVLDECYTKIENWTLP